LLADNDLSDVPAQIGLLTRLRMLDLGHNELTLIPEALGDLSGLTDFLYLQDNRLTSLPSSLARLTRLRYLNISAHRFEARPECICSMASLIELRASDNQLTELRQIDLRGNPLMHVPAALATLPRLEKLDLRWVTTLIAPHWFADLEANGCAIYR
jgi:Leucine-rich repeat (LRR) protein